MEPVYTDVHIHTSENPDNINLNYDIDTLFKKIREHAQGQHSLISLTDHNTINRTAYQKALEKKGDDIHLLLGVELHIHYDIETEAYHCHIFFGGEISMATIDRINTILDQLYVKKTVEKADTNIPTLDRIINEFDSFDFVLLPHGGQSHATFDKSIPKGKKFDTTMERSIYYNQFDGFTSRSDKGREDTDRYFQKLGISDFVNLITCSDNYEPTVYPNAKAANAAPFIPTWMLASPTFEGFRLSLSEKSRLCYSLQKPASWSEKIESVNLKNDLLDIDVQFSSGLNVVIGGSSSGKTLLVDSLYRKISSESFQDSKYAYLGVESMNVVNPSNMKPHFISQNYIMKVVGDGDEHRIENIDIIKSLFPDDKAATQLVAQSLNTLKQDITALIDTVKRIETIENSFRSTQQIGHLIVLNDLKKNIFSAFVPKAEQRVNISYTLPEKQKHISTLDEISLALSRNPFVDSYSEEINKLKKAIESMHLYSELENKIYEEISLVHGNYASYLKKEQLEEQTKAQIFDTLLNNITKYAALIQKFKVLLQKIASNEVKIDTKVIRSAGHQLYISNQFKIDKQTVIETFNGLLKSGKKIESFDKICPTSLYSSNFSKQKPKVVDYEDFINRVYNSFVSTNKTIYKIITKENVDFDKLSAGWKTSVLLDLILSYTDDIAPIIIDQPEDNLATKYINDGLVKAIKEVKNRKQIILVSHNATIPMMGDAQCIVFCQNNHGNISIRSASLEGNIGNHKVLDLIASITDGGKPSIKKRVKKYNLKKFKE